MIWKRLQTDSFLEVIFALPWESGRGLPQSKTLAR
jgi:hypothetical protein